MATTAAASGQPLQQGRAFSSRSRNLLGCRRSVTGQTPLIHFKSNPVDKAGMVIGNQDGPLLLRQKLYSLAHPSGLVDVAFTAAFTIRVGSCIDGVAQNRMNGNVGRLDPEDLSIRTL